MGLIAHAVGGEHLAPQFEVSGLDRSRVFPDLAEVGIDAPLARLVGNYRNVHVRLLAAVPVGRGPSLVDLHGAFVGLLRDVILVGRDARAGRRTAVQMPRVEFAAVGGQLLDEVEVAGDLVAVAVEDEGWRASRGGRSRSALRPARRPCPTWASRLRGRRRGGRPCGKPRREGTTSGNGCGSVRSP